MVLIIIHIAYITCLVINDALHAYNAIGVHKIHHEAGRISYFAEPALLWLDGTLIGDVGTRSVQRNWQYCGWLDGHGRGRSP